MATADNVFCSNCGDKIEGEPPDAYDLAQRKPCPRCGSVARSINLQASGFSVAGSSAKMALITRWWEKDWPLVIDFVIATLGGAITSYWTNGWLSGGHNSSRVVYGVGGGHDRIRGSFAAPTDATRFNVCPLPFEHHGFSLWGLEKSSPWRGKKEGAVRPTFCVSTAAKPARRGKWETTPAGRRKATPDAAPPSPIAPAISPARSQRRTERQPSPSSFGPSVLFPPSVQSARRPALEVSYASRVSRCRAD